MYLMCKDQGTISKWYKIKYILSIATVKKLYHIVLEFCRFENLFTYPFILPYVTLYPLAANTFSDNKVDTTVIIVN